MELENRNELRLLNKEFEKLTSECEKLNFIVKSYIAAPKKFHKNFLNSSLIYQVDINLLLEALEKNKEIDPDIYLNDLLFFIHSLNKKKNYLVEIDKNLNSDSITISELFNYLEIIRYNFFINQTSIDGGCYPEEILESQYLNLIDSFPNLLSLLIDKNIEKGETQNKKAIKRKDNYKNIYRLNGLQASINNFITLVMAGHYTSERYSSNFQGVNLTNNHYFMKHKDKGWRALEIYRDLNYNYNENKESLQIYKLGLDEEIMYIKLEERDQTDYVYNLLKEEIELVCPMYGSVSNKFEFENEIFQISDLFDIFISMRKFISKNRGIWNQEYQNKGVMQAFSFVGENRLLRLLKIEPSKKKLLKLLSFDMDSGLNSSLLNYKPLIIKDSLYCFIPSWIEHISIGRAVDKILTENKVNPVKLLEINKGYLFENTVESFLKEKKIPFYNLNKDEKHKIDEVDGMFILDNYLFLYEAKAAIKPGSQMEAYNLLNSRLAKAGDQLEIRMDMFEDPLKIEKIEEKLKIELSKYNIIPFILSSNHFFNGFNGIESNRKEIIFPIIDFLTLKEIINTKKATVWKYNERSRTYRKLFIDIKDGKSLKEYLYNQIHLVNREKDRYQILEDGIIFQIASPPKSNY